MPVVDKKEARPAKTRQQSRPTKVRTADGEHTPLSDREKWILLAATKAVARCLKCTWEVTAARMDPDPRRFVLATVALSTSLRRASVQARAVAKMGARIRKETR